MHAKRSPGYPSKTEREVAGSVCTTPVVGVSVGREEEKRDGAGSAQRLREAGSKRRARGREEHGERRGKGGRSAARSEVRDGGNETVSREERRT